MQNFNLEHATGYNALLGIAEAHRTLEEIGGDEVVGELLSVIYEAGLGDEVGIRLLHKHNDITSSEIMFEVGGVDEEGFALITSASPVHEASEYVCNSWRLENDRFVAVEFSTKALLKKVDASRLKLLFETLSRVILEKKVENLLGPSINYSEDVLSHAPTENYAFLEKTDFEDRANVVRFVDRNDEAFENSAKTKWYARKTIDAAGRPTWTTACNCFCSVFPSGGHQGTTTHRYTPSEESPTEVLI